MSPDMTPKLLMIAALSLLAACGKGDASCATDADCFAGEVCVKPQKVCEDPAKDLGADLAPDDMGAPDLAQPGDMGDDMAPDMEVGPANLPLQIAAGDATPARCSATVRCAAGAPMPRVSSGWGQADPRCCGTPSWLQTWSWARQRWLSRRAPRTPARCSRATWCAAGAAALTDSSATARRPMSALRTPR